jgi:hypothetical protein
VFVFSFGAFSLNLYVSVVVVGSGLSTMQTQIGNSTLSQKKKNTKNLTLI